MNLRNTATDADIDYAVAGAWAQLYPEDDGA